MRAAAIGAPSFGATVQTVSDTLFARIDSELHAMDERLPSGRMLAAEPCVSRSALREALESRRVIGRRAASGGILTHRPKPAANAAPAPRAADTSPLQHLAVRGVQERDKLPTCTHLASLGGDITAGKQFFLTGEGPFLQPWQEPEEQVPATRSQKETIS